MESPEREKKKIYIYNFPVKGSNSTKDWANTKEELADCIQASPPLSARCRDEDTWQPEPEGKGLLQSRPQRLASSTKLWAGSQLLTMSSWDPGWLTSARRVAAWDQLPRGDTWHTREPERLGLRRWLRCTAHLGQGTRQAPARLSCSDVGRAHSACPTESLPL